MLNFNKNKLQLDYHANNIHNLILLILLHLPELGELLTNNKLDILLYFLYL